MPETNPFDPQDMNTAIEALGANLKSGWLLGLQLEVPEVGSLRQVVICGMGGSAIGGISLQPTWQTSCLSRLWRTAIMGSLAGHADLKPL